MHTAHPLPRPVALVVMLGLLVVMPLSLYVAVRVGAQPAADFITHQFGGTPAVLLPRQVVNWLAVLGAVVGTVLDLQMLIEE